MARPRAVHKDGLTYYQIKKAASSSIQHALGIEFHHWTKAKDLPGTHFTVWRDPCERLASLFVGCVNPTVHGFYQPFEQHSIYRGMPFDEFIETVCDLPATTCEQHLVVANWPDLVPQLQVYHFSNLDALPIEIEFIGVSVAAMQPDYTQHLRTLVHRRYQREYALYEDRLGKYYAKR